jgi:hypothetical protein
MTSVKKEKHVPRPSASDRTSRVKARRRLDDFIRYYRDVSTTFGEDLIWAENYWSAAGVSFGNLDQGTKVLRQNNLMKQPFIDFAKAYFRHKHSVRPSSDTTEMRALRCLERALCEKYARPDVLKVSHAILDRAAAIARQHYKVGSSYYVGNALVAVSNLLAKKGFIPRSLIWRNPIPRVQDRLRTGPAAREERNRKMPDIDALISLGRIFASRPVIARDNFTTCCTALLLSAPLRISEVLALREDCEVYEKKRDGSDAYGRRHQPGKGATPRITWVHQGMVEIAREAIQRIRHMTEEARKLAVWLEKHPDEFYRHERCPQVAEDFPLSLEQCGEALTIAGDRARIAFKLRKFGLPSRDGQNSLFGLNKWVHSNLPSDFPWFDRKRNIRFSEALFCLRAHELRTDMPPLPYMLWKPTVVIYNTDVASQDAEKNKPPGIFDRNQHDPKCLRKFKIRSHQLRHYISTLCENGGMSQELLAEWAARKDMKQNRAYNNLDEFQLVDLLRQHDLSLKVDRSQDEIATQIRASIPMTRQEFNTLAHPTAHITALGFCIHDWVMETCQHHRDCILCDEQIVIKGDMRLNHLRGCFEKVRDLRLQAEHAVAEGNSGADRWYEHQVLTENALSKMLEILDDQTIENGTIIRLSRESTFSPLRRTMESKGLVEPRSFVQITNIRPALSEQSDG